MFSKLKDEGNVTSFTLKCKNVAIANTVRRCISEVKSIAFTDTVVESQKANVPKLISHPEQIALNVQYSPIPDIDANDVIKKGASLYMSINVSNDTDDDLLVTSQDAKYYLNGTLVKVRKQEDTLPWHFYTLRRNQTFNMKSEATIGVHRGSNQPNACYQVAKWIKYAPNYSEDGTFQGTCDMTMKSMGIYPNKYVLYRGCKTFANKLDDIIDKVKSQSQDRDDDDDDDTSSDTFSFVLIGENDTIGHLVVTYLNEFPKEIPNVSYKMDRYAGKKLTIELRCSKGDPKDWLIKGFTDIKTIFEKMTKELSS